MKTPRKGSKDGNVAKGAEGLLSCASKLLTHRNEALLSHAGSGTVKDFKGLLCGPHVSFGSIAMSATM